MYSCSAKTFVAIFWLPSKDFRFARKIMKKISDVISQPNIVTIEFRYHLSSLNSLQIEMSIQNKINYQALDIRDTFEV